MGMSSDRTRGVLISLLAVGCVTPDAMLLRWAREEGASDWQTVFWKLSMMGVFNLLTAWWLAGGVQALIASARGDPAALMFASLLQVCDQLGFTFSFLKTETARAMLFISLNPVWAALLGRAILGDVLQRRTLGLLAAGVVSALIVFTPSFFAPPTDPDGGAAASTTQHQPQTLGGDLIALATGLCLASYVTFIRFTAKHRPSAGIDAAPSIGNFIAAAISLPIVAHTRGGVAEGVHLASYLPVVGVNAALMSVFYVGFTLAPRYLPGAEVGLILLLETLLGPLWVFWRFSDAPSLWTVGGGVLLLVALISHELAGIFESRRHSGRHSGGGLYAASSPFGSSERLSHAASLSPPPPDGAAKVGVVLAAATEVHATDYQLLSAERRRP